MEVVQRAAGRPAAYFVFVVFIMAEFPLGKIGILGGGILQNMMMSSE